MTAKNIQDIYQYIQENGNYLSSQKILREAEKHPDTIWLILVKLCSDLKNKNIQNAYAQMVFSLEDSQKHERSSKWLKEFMDIKDLADKFKLDFGILDYIKPDKEKTINLISKIVEISRGVKRIRVQLDQLIVKEEIVSKDLIKFKSMEEITAQQLQGLKERKQNQLPLYEEKVKACQELNKEINSRRQQKLDLISSQKLLQEQIYQKEKILDDSKYECQNDRITIEQLKKEIALNAPQVKKEKKAVQEQYLSLTREYHMKQQLTKSKQRQILNYLQIRKKHEENIVILVKKMIQKFYNFGQAKERLSRHRQENQNVNKKRNQLNRKEAQYRDQKNDLEMKNKQSKMHQQSERRETQTCQAQKKQKQEIFEQILNETLMIKEKYEQIQEINKRTSQKVDELKMHYYKKKEELRNRQKQWLQMTLTNIQRLYADFQSRHF